MLLNPETILARSLKARYFPRTDILLANNAHNPSFIWNSLLVGRELLLEGIAWKVGSGNRIRFGCDRWLPSISGGFVTAKVPEAWKETKLTDFILDNPLSWDFDGLAEFLEPGDLWKVTSQIVPSLNRPDSPFWPDGKFNSYTVKSGYHLACSLSQRSEASSSNQDESLWHWIWGLEVLPKIKLFMWKCLAGAIPTSQALLSRSINIDPLCRRCGNDFETLEHALRDCPWASFIWEVSPLRLSPAPANGHCSIAAWFEIIRQIPHGETHKSFANLVWAIWHARNLLVFQDKEISHFDCLSASQRVIWNRLVSTPKAAAPPVAVECRRDHQVRIFCDASVVEGVGVGIGVVVKDKDGLVQCCCYGFLHGVFTVLEGEAKAVHTGLQLCKDRNFDDAIAVTDSQLLYWCLVNGELDLSYLGDTLAGIRLLAAELRFCAFSWTPREGNANADGLAKLAMSCRTVFTFSDVLPNLGNLSSLS
ncbi:uncharacterized protein LOC130993991 [Salvia miltiorrhiza]|uniref:uncharacterized protein LOC130993991 n=1 Tax=Salvia miltiorrhiza TaxID=226208 RepID=UPI0025ACA40F|nr:uncharacterized protein LOC130993991 [Salvia miltiorrhiza]